MAFSDYQLTPALNTTIGDSIYIGPDMARNDVREALQQIVADGRGLYDDMIGLVQSGNVPVFATQAAGEAGTATGDLFAYADGTGTITYAMRTAGGSDVLGEAATQTHLDNSLSELIDLSTILPVTAATSLDANALNKMVVAGDGAADYTIELPPAAVGAALKLVVARDCTKLVEVTAEAASGLTVDGLPAIHMVAGESATVVYDGAGWILLDRVRLPFVAEMFTSGSTTLAVGSFTDVPFPTNGAQLTRVDQSAMWNASGFFQAPRAGIYEVTIDVWLELTTAPGQVDVGFYVGSVGGQSPGNQYFTRAGCTNDSFNKVLHTAVFSIPEGQRIYSAVRLNGPITAGNVASAVVSRLTVREVFQ